MAQRIYPNDQESDDRIIPIILASAGDIMMPLPWNGDITDHIKEQLATIAPALHEILRRVIEEHPHALVFLDKSARHFAVPFLQCFHALEITPVPKILYYNDQDAKKRYIDDTLEVDFVRAQFGDLSNKKIFVVDETFSAGKGAATIFSMMRLIWKQDLTYFALTRDPHPYSGNFAWDQANLDRHFNIIWEILKDPRFVIFKNDISQLFSRNHRYVEESEWPDGLTHIRSAIGAISEARLLKVQENDQKRLNGEQFGSISYPVSEEEYLRLCHLSSIKLRKNINEAILQTLLMGNPRRNGL